MLDDREAQAAASALAGSIGVDAIEALEDARQRLRGDTRPVVLHLDDGVARIAARIDADRAPIGAVLDGVVDEVLDDLLDAYGITERLHVFSDVDLDTHPTRLGAVAHRLGDVTRDGGEVHRFADDLRWSS